jgi:hypothetical protein
VDRLARGVVLGCCLGGVAACGAATAAEPASTAAGTTPAAPTTVVVTSTSGAPTTTLSPQQRDEAEIREIHDRFFRLMTGDEPAPDDPQNAAVMTGIELQRSMEYDSSLAEAWQHIEGNVRSRTIELRFVDADHATLKDCTLSTSRTIAADGTVVAGDPSEPFVTALQIVRTTDGWRVSDWLTGGRQACTF